jgi:hypothetical protein
MIFILLLYFRHHFFPFPTIAFCFIYLLIAKQVLFLLRYLFICLISKLCPTRLTILAGPVYDWKLYLWFPTNQEQSFDKRYISGGKAENGERMNNVISCLQKSFLVHSCLRFRVLFLEGKYSILRMINQVACQAIKKFNKWIKNTTVYNLYITEYGWAWTGEN